MSTPQAKEQLPSPTFKDKKKPQKPNSRRKKGITPTDTQQTGENTSLRKIIERQTLLDRFCKTKTINEHTANTVSTNFLKNSTQKAELEQQLKKKDKQIEKLQIETKNELQKTSRMRQEYFEFCQKTKQSILQSKLELAALQRKHKGEVNVKFGNYRDISCNNFVEGSYLSEFKSKITKTEHLIIELELRKSKSSQQERVIVMCQLEFMKRQLSELKQELRVREKQVETYKQQLKLHVRSLECIFAKDGWPLLKNRYQPLEFIGSGGFGQVYKGFDLETYNEIAIKIHNLDKESPQNFDILAKHLNREIKIHKQLKHPNIVRMIDQLQLQDNRIGLVMQYCSGPELKNYLRKEVCLEQRQSKFIIKQVIYAVKYLHDQKYSVIHYDLKPANILFHNGTVKIADFGISKINESEDSRMDLTSPRVGTYYYLPPEVFRGYSPKISSKVDVWSIGVIFFQMLYGKKPFGHGIPQNKLLQSGELMAERQVEFPISSPKNYKISEQAKDFIRRCLEHDAQKRMSSQQAYDHDYIKY